MLRKLWNRLFPNRRLRLETIRFLCEQDGDIERQLKRELVERFEVAHAETRAYLVRAEWPRSSGYNVIWF